MFFNQIIAHLVVFFCFKIPTAVQLITYKRAVLNLFFLLLSDEIRAKAETEEAFRSGVNKENGDGSTNGAPRKQSRNERNIHFTPFVSSASAVFQSLLSNGELEWRKENECEPIQQRQKNVVWGIEPRLPYLFSSVMLVHAWTRFCLRFCFFRL